MSSSPQINAMTVDVEDYFHVSAFEKVISPKDWSTCQPTVDYNTKRILDLFDRHDIKATFFTLGWVAQAFPELIKEIDSRGHEVASHGTQHRRASTQSPEQFREDVSQSLSLLQDLTGKQIKGYRAPSFSIGSTNEWAYQILAELGLLYSSSTYPIKHDLYGNPDWPRFAYMRDEGIVEVPIPTVENKGENVGIGGGGFFRLYPYWFSKQRINRFLTENQAPYSFYFHPWEIDPSQPKVKGAGFKSSFRHYINLSRMEAKIANLLSDYQWSTMWDAYQIQSIREQANG